MLVRRCFDVCKSTSLSPKILRLDAVQVENRRYTNQLNCNLPPRLHLPGQLMTKGRKPLPTLSI